MPDKIDRRRPDDQIRPPATGNDHPAPGWPCRSGGLCRGDAGGPPRRADRSEDDRQQRHGPVRAALVPDPRHEPQANGGQIGDRKRHPRQLQRHRDTHRQFRPDLESVLETGADIPRQPAPEPVAVLCDHGAVEPGLCLEPAIACGVASMPRAARDAEPGTRSIVTNRLPDAIRSVHVPAHDRRVGLFQLRPAAQLSYHRNHRGSYRMGPLEPLPMAVPDLRPLSLCAFGPCPVVPERHAQRRRRLRVNAVGRCPAGRSRRPRA